MQAHRDRTQEEAEDLFFGQLVIIWARWFVIASGIIYALWFSSTPSQLTVAVILLAVIMGVNFFVHGRYLMEKPINRLLLLGLSFVDLVMITAIIAFGPGEGGLDNPLFVFFYIILLAFAFVFPQAYTTVYTGITLLVYAATCILMEPGIVADARVLEILVLRIIVMAAMGGLGTYYWRIQRNRRHEMEQRFSPVP